MLHPNKGYKVPNNIFFLPALLQKLVSDFFFDFWEGNFVGTLAGILRDFFGPTKDRLNNFGENFVAFFVRNSCLEKEISCQLRSADVPL